MTNLTQSTLHIEIKLKERDGLRYARADAICEDVSEWILTTFNQLSIGQTLDEFETLSSAYLIDNITVVDHSGSLSAKTFNSVYELANVQLDIQAYDLREDDLESFTAAEDVDAEEEVPQARITALPSKSLDGIWGVLIFDADIPGRLLRYLTRMMALSRNPKLDINHLNWNRLILLYGPPGTGKTTLCKALAQKLSIRLSRHFTQSKLVEISSQSLLSRWFGQSGRLVSKMFDEIRSLAEDEETLVCVLIDEVESITGSRENAQGSECNDALRATNQILTGLDQLRAQPNVLVFATSNLLSAIDPAFLDRTDIKQFITTPGTSAIYEILRSTLNELLKCEAIRAPVHPRQVVVLMDDDEVTIPSTPSTPSTVLDSSLVRSQIIPPLCDVKLDVYDEADGPGGKLWEIAQKCQDVSGRTLRRLPFSAIALYTYTETCSLSEALEALEKVVHEEVRGGEGMMMV